MLAAVIHAAFPVFALIMTGWLCARYKLLNALSMEGLNKFVIYLDGRDALGRRLGAAGIPTKVHYATALCREPIFGMRQPNGDFPRALLHAETALSLPIHGHLSDVEIDRVIAAVRGFFD